MQLYQILIKEGPPFASSNFLPWFTWAIIFSCDELESTVTLSTLAIMTHPLRSWRITTNVSKVIIYDWRWDRIGNDMAYAA